MPIFGKISDVLAQARFGTRIQRGLEFLKEVQDGRRPDVVRALEAQQPGDNERFEIDGDAVFALAQSYDSIPRAEGKYEAHRRYIDLQYIHAGKEGIECRHLDDQVLPDFDLQRDVGFTPLSDAAESRLRLGPGDVAILYPTDLHAPRLIAEGAPERIRKIVIKVECE